MVVARVEQNGRNATSFFLQAIVELKMPNKLTLLAVGKHGKRSSAHPLISYTHSISLSLSFLHTQVNKHTELLLLLFLPSQSFFIHSALRSNGRPSYIKQVVKSSYFCLSFHTNWKTRFWHWSNFLQHKHSHAHTNTHICTLSFKLWKPFAMGRNSQTQHLIDLLE